MKFNFAFVIILFICFDCNAQQIDNNGIEKIFSNRNEKISAPNFLYLKDIYLKADSATRADILNFAEKESHSSNLYTAARSLYWKGLIVFRPPFNSKNADVFFQQAINRAIESGDEYLMVECFEMYAYHCLNGGKYETVLFYFLKSTELRNKLGDNYFYEKNQQVFGTVGDLYFRIEDYNQAMNYLQRSLSNPIKDTIEFISHNNTIALCYQRMGNLDSALIWFNKALQLSLKYQNKIWAGIINGNIGAVYFDKKEDNKALPLLWNDYNNTFNQEINSAANTLHRIALIYLRQGKTDSAYLLAKKGFNIVTTYKAPNALYISNAYKTLSEIFKKKGNLDSAFFYADFYHRINDSINIAIAHNRADVVQTKLDFEKTNNQIITLVNEKQVEKFHRNLLLAGILLLITAGWFYFRWQKLRNYNARMELIHQKENAENEMKNAQEKLDEFTQHSIDRNNLIEKLQEQLATQNIQANEELLNQTILTENDWLRFKDIFDKANPGFINQLRNVAPDITTAEIRLATLIKLSLGNKHIAGMLGISTDAVRKTKSRLRQRLQINTETELESFVKNIRS